MSARISPVTTVPSPAISYHAAERAVVRAVPLRHLTVLEQMYAYFGSDRA